MMSPVLLSQAASGARDSGAFPPKHREKADTAAQGGFFGLPSFFSATIVHNPDSCTKPTPLIQNPFFCA
jgi:hypothetical protein